MSSIALIQDAFNREFTEKIFSDSAKTPIDMVYLSLFFLDRFRRERSSQYILFFSIEQKFALIAVATMVRTSKDCNG